MRRFLDDEQIAETLERYGFADDAPLSGISYDGDQVRIVIGNSPVRILTVPPDILERPAPAPGRARIFSH
ncbi:MAG: hypothetical protein ACT4PO_12245 [Actinomycetota bacterium]